MSYILYKIPLPLLFVLRFGPYNLEQISNFVALQFYWRSITLAIEFFIKEYICFIYQKDCWSWIAFIMIGRKYQGNNFLSLFIEIFWLRQNHSGDTCLKIRFICIENFFANLIKCSIFYLWRNVKIFIELLKILSIPWTQILGIADTIDLKAN